MTNPDSNELTISGNENTVSDITQVKNIYNYNRHFTDIMKDVFAELREIIVSDENEYIAAEDSFILEEIIMNLEEDFYDKDTTEFIISFVKQMKANSPQLDDTPRLNSLVIFLTIISFCGGEYSFRKADNDFYKIHIVLADQDYDFSLYNLKLSNKKLLKLIVPNIIRFLIRKEFSPPADDKVLLCGSKFACNKQCLDDDAILKVIIDNFTDVTKYEARNPDFFTGLRKDPYISCGNCLTEDIYDYQKAAEIIEVIFADD